MTGHPTNGYILLGILMKHAPDAKAQALLSQKYSNICREVALDMGSGWDLEVEKTMAVMLSNGLQYGNWPWSTMPGVTES